MSCEDCNRELDRLRARFRALHDAALVLEAERNRWRDLCRDLVEEVSAGFESGRLNPLAMPGFRRARAALGEGEHG